MKDYKKKQADLFTLDNPHSIVTEQFRMMRTSILRLAKYKNIKTILVTSAFPGEGKTFVASNLAINFARGFNGSVILVDTDLRRPSIHKLFKTKQEGLANFLLYERKLSDLLCETDIQNLLILPAGQQTDEPSELLSSKKMKRLIEELKSLYQDCYIIFDCVPVLLSEAVAMADLVDGVLLVVKANKTGRKDVKKAIENLGKERAVGVILNFSKNHLKAYQGYYHYYKKK